MKRFGFSTMPKCINCGHWFWYYEMMYLNKDGQHICQKCSERKRMPNIKITAEVNGKIVPLNTISTETFEAIKALEKPKEIPVARLAGLPGEPRLIFKPKVDIIELKTGNIYALDCRRGRLAAEWPIKEDASGIEQYRNVRPL